MYDCPVRTGEVSRQTLSMITVRDNRPDKGVDKYLATSLPDAISGVVARELVLQWKLNRNGSPPGEAQTFPVQVDIELLETAVGAPRYGTKAVAGVGATVIAGVFGIVLVARSPTDVFGLIRMHVQVRNVSSGSHCEDTWTGTSTLKVPQMDADSSQTHSKVLGAAIKSAISKLPAALVCIDATASS